MSLDMRTGIVRTELLTVTMVVQIEAAAIMADLLQLIAIGAALVL
jgi:hypothetical protein